MMFLIWKFYALSTLEEENLGARNTSFLSIAIIFSPQCFLSEYFLDQGQIQRFLKEGALYVGHHGWQTKKNLVFRWSKKAKRTLETKVFGQTFLSIF